MDDWPSKFKLLKSPEGINPVTCYIDHATHPYNYTKAPDPGAWCEDIWSKGVNLIWNYIDGSDGNIFTLNQLNAKGFSARKIMESFRIMQKEGYRRSRKDNLRNLLLYFVDERLSSLSIKLKVYPKRLITERDFSYIPAIARVLFTVFFQYLLNPGFYFKFVRNYSKPFSHARFSPVIFKGINQSDSNVRVMQTVAVRDFDITFSDKAINMFIDEKGVCIAHTYFATMRSYHIGRLFENSNYLFRKPAVDAFINIAELIKAKKIWNPSISELSDYFTHLENLKYKIDEKGNIVIDKAGNKNIVCRTLSLNLKK
jgi:hypothetical protein